MAGAEEDFRLKVAAHPRKAFARRYSQSSDAAEIPELLTIQEMAGILRTSPKAIYAMVERAQLPGVVRIGRRVLIRRDALAQWLDQKQSHASLLA